MHPIIRKPAPDFKGILALFSRKRFSNGAFTKENSVPLNKKEIFTNNISKLTSIKRIAITFGKIILNEYGLPVRITIKAIAVKPKQRAVITLIGIQDASIPLNRSILNIQPVRLRMLMVSTINTENQTTEREDSGTNFGNANFL